MVDRLAVLLDKFSVTASVFHTGTLCGINDLPADGDIGQLHLIRRGVIEISNSGASAVRVTEPSLLLYPRPLAHRFSCDPVDGADLACANLRFDGGADNPIASALPGFIWLPLSAVQEAGSVLELLFTEAFAQNCGRQAVLNRLFEVILIQVIRQLMEEGRVEVGLLSGLAHPRLRLALVAMHENPAHAWSLDELAIQAGMSRSAFAKTFRERVGCTPGVYLQRWRIGLARRAMLQGRPLKLIAIEVGYGSEAAFSRAFKSCCGVSPGRWASTLSAAANLKR